MGILAMIFNIIVCVGIPLACLLFYLLLRRGQLPAFLLGAATFLVFQTFTRLPLVNLLEERGVFSPLPTVVYLLLLCFTAGLFEEVGRWVVMQVFLKKQLAPASGIAFGLGHGGVEALTIAGIACVRALITQPGMLTMLPFGTVAVTGVERLLTIVVQVAFSLLVMHAVRTNRPRWLLAAIGLHALVDFVLTYCLHVLGLSIWAIEAMLALLAAASVVYILHTARRAGTPSISKEVP